MWPINSALVFYLFNSISCVWTGFGVLCGQSDICPNQGPWGKACLLYRFPFPACLSEEQSDKAENRSEDLTPTGKRFQPVSSTSFTRTPASVTLVTWKPARDAWRWHEHRRDLAGLGSGPGEPGRLVQPQRIHS